MNSSIDGKLIEFGRFLESAGWQPENGMAGAFESGGDDEESRFIYRARLFIRSVEKTIRKTICTAEGSVRPEVKSAANVATIFGSIMEDQTGSTSGADMLGEIFLDVGLEVYCAS